MKPAFKYIIDNRFDRRKFKKIRRRVNRHNQINLKKLKYRQTNIIRGKIFNPMRVPSQIQITGLRFSNFWKFSTSKFFLKILQEIIKKNVISRKLQGFEQSYLEAKIATLESTLQSLTAEMGISNFVNFFISKLSEFFFQIPKKRHISKTTRI